METKENQYLSLKVDLGALGEVYLMVLNNNKKEKPTDPDVRVLIQGTSNLKQCGAGWINTKKQSQVSNAVVEEHI
jgi:uncharacterized protein (DUF736 family)